jgi:hypothetical protein
VQKKKKSVYGGSVKTHIEASGEEQPVSDWIFLVDNIIITETMNSEIKDWRVTIFVVRETGK